MRILAVSDLVGAEDQVAVDMARAIALKDAIDRAQAKDKKKDEPAEPKSQNPWGMTDGAFVATVVIVGLSPILGVSWLYGKLKKR